MSSRPKAGRPGIFYKKKKASRVKGHGSESITTRGVGFRECWTVTVYSKKFFRDQGLTIVLLLMFAFSLGGMALAGLAAVNAEQLQHGGPAISLAQFLTSSRFISATFENWDSEFLQMASYVILTAYLFQRGSSESRDPDSPYRPKDAAAAVSWVYAHSLGLALIALFLLSFVLHWLASAADAANQAALHGQTAGGVLDHLGDSQFWFESFQN